MRATAQLLILLICAAAHAIPVGGQELAISGRAIDGEGRPLAGVAIRLLPILSPFDQALLELSGVALPEAETSERTGAAGTFRLMAPEAGFWRLVAEAPGRAPMEFAFRREPLLEATSLPELVMEPARTIGVEVVDPAGAQLAGAWIETSLTSSEPSWSRSPRWRPHAPRALSIGGAKTSILVPPDHDVELQAWKLGHRASAKLPAPGGSSRLSLQAGFGRRLRVVDSAGHPVQGAVVRVGEVGWPASRTGADGLLDLHQGPEGARATILTADGQSASIRLAQDEGTAGEPFEARLEDLRVVNGRVLHALSRRPVAGAFVYPTAAVGRHVKTDDRGGFALPLPDRQRVAITAAAPHFLHNGAWVDAASTSLTIVLDPATNLPGLVLDGSREPVAAAEIFARPHGDSLQDLRELYRSPSRQTVSDDEGGFVLARLKDGLPYSITARLDGFAPAEVIVRDLKDTAAAGGVVLELTRGATLTGRVVAPDGRGVPGATLTLERVEKSEAMRYMGRDSGQADPFRFEFSTQAEGEFASADTPTGEFNLQVEASGFAPEVLPVFEIVLGARSHDLGIIDLEPGVALGGRVVDPDGLPLAGAKISLQTREGAMFSGSSGANVQSITGADGMFTFADRRRGEFLDLAVQLAGYAEREVPRVEVPPESPLEVTLEPAVTLRGRVVDPQGQAITGASITVAREGGGSSYGGQVVSWPRARGRSDEFGRFEVVDIEPGAVRLTAVADGWLPTHLGDIELTASREPEELEIELQPGATVSGRVLAADGSPASEAMIRVQDSMSSRSRGATSDGDGNYSLGGVEPGLRQITAHHDGRQSVEEVEVKPGNNRLDFLFEPGVEVSGTVVSPDGDPVEGAVLTLSAPGTRSYRGRNSVRSDAGGGFKIEHVLPGLFELTAEHPAFGSTALEEPLEVSTAPIAGLLVRLAAGVELVGSVLGATPEELVGIELVAVKQEGGVYKEGRVDSAGGYRVANLSAGAWQVWVQSASGRQASEPLDIAEGETQVVLDIEFKEGLVLSGRVLQRGEPLGGAWVFAGSADIESGASAETDHQGRFRLTGLAAGSYTLRVSHFATGLSHSEPIDLRRDDEVLIELEGAAVAGRVTDRSGHAPLAGATIVLEASSEGDEGTWYSAAKGATTDSDGRYRLSDISPGRYNIRVTKAGYAAQSQALEVDDDDLADLDFDLEEVEGLSLTVLLPAGVPATQISYAVLDLAGGLIQGGRQTATDEGLVRLATVPDGDWTVMVEVTGFAVSTLRTRAPRENVTVRLERAATLALRVEELVHDATTVATLRVTGADGLTFKSLSWNGQPVDHWRLRAGRATLASLPAGRFILAISTTDGRSWERSVNLEAGSNDEVVFD